jgi:hypothetical protein
MTLTSKLYQPLLKKPVFFEGYGFQDTGWELSWQENYAA